MNVCNSTLFSHTHTLSLSHTRTHAARRGVKYERASAIVPTFSTGPWALDLYLVGECETCVRRPRPGVTNTARIAVGSGRRSSVIERAAPLLSLGRCSLSRRSPPKHLR